MSTPPLKAIRIWAHLIGVPLDLRYNQGLSLVAGLVGEPKETDDFTRNLVSLTVSHVKVEVDLTKPLPSVVEFERQSGEVPLNPPISTTSQFAALINLPTDFSPAHLNNQLILASTPEPPFRPSLKRSRSSPTLLPPHLSKNTCPNPFILHTSKSTLSLPPNPKEPTLSLPPIPKAHPDIFASPNCPKKLLIPLPLLNEYWLHTNKPLFGAILESHIKELSLLHLMATLCSGWHYVSNHLSDADGRIILIWKDPLKLQVVH
ncbi:unnamed protein product, partial [Brassica rapa subsp. narinosa]